MAVRDVLALPHSVLQSAAADIDDINDVALQLARDLVETMHVSPGCVGLAATQIGVGLRAFCVDTSGHKKAKSANGLVQLFNPRIVKSEGRILGREGCMSVPDLTGDVNRYEFVVVEGLNLEGELVQYESDAFEARAFQHEIDHLDGLLFLDRVQSAQGVFPRKVYKG